LEFAKSTSGQRKNIPLDELRPMPWPWLKTSPFTCFAAVGSGPTRRLQYWLKPATLNPPVVVVGTLA